RRISFIYFKYSEYKQLLVPNKQSNQTNYALNFKIYLNKIIPLINYNFMNLVSTKVALQALKLLRNADDIQSGASDYDDNGIEVNDDFINDFEDEMETTNQPNAEYDLDEDSDNEETEDEEEPEETYIDKTSKNGTIWTRLKEKEETSCVMETIRTLIVTNANNLDVVLV
ncbi:hypothetical protein BpHYR1_040120, partial [Brachionus plicatilis]